MWIWKLENQNRNYVTCHKKCKGVIIYNNLTKYYIIIVCLIGIFLRHSENTVLKSYDVVIFLIKKKRYNGLQYVIQSLGVNCFDLQVAISPHK